ncbi:MAG TPA: exodeoxyribonuclease VII small subunit [Steroidobacteraceae bacterium]|jgi:exodeoxyribonuclease VII small subunit
MTRAVKILASEPKESEPAPDFEQALAELETLVERLERGDLPLEEALRTFERGVTLTRHCQSALKTAQQKVEILLKRNGALGVEPFATADDAGRPSGEDDAD